MTPDQIIAIVPLILYIVAHLAAIFGKPKIVEEIDGLNKIVDVVSANYGKAKNTPKV